MNNKVAINSQLSTIESKKQNKQKKQNRKRIIDMEVIWRIVNWEWEGENREKAQGIRSIIGRYKINRGS